MALGKLYEPKEAGTKLTLVREPVTYVKTEDQARLDVITDLQGLPAATRTVLAKDGPGSLAEYDQELQDEEWEIRDRLDYYTYPTRTDQRTVADGEWFLPEAVESFCAEDLGNEATLSIDGLNTTFWRDSTDHEHSIVYRLRNYPKKVSKVRWRYGGSAARERLNDIDIHASKNLNKIDDAANILETGINPTWTAGPAVWIEHTLAAKKAKARYIKMVVGNTDNASNQLQLREFQVFVETRLPSDPDNE